ncbi:MAG: hypothetical protein RID09_26835 [Coleofasciculus sp. G1-WW12-02]
MGTGNGQRGTVQNVCRFSPGNETQRQGVSLLGNAYALPNRQRGHALYW